MDSATHNTSGCAPSNSVECRPGNLLSTFNLGLIHCNGASVKSPKWSRCPPSLVILVRSPIKVTLCPPCLPKIRRSLPVHSVYALINAMFPPIDSFKFIFNNARLLNSVALSIPPNGGNILAWRPLWGEPRHRLIPH